MLKSLLSIVIFCLLQRCLVLAQGSDDGYIGYSLTERGDPDSVIYETRDTPSKASANATNGPPDVRLNATVHVGELDIEVQNLTAQINLAAQVLSLLKFNAGVDASIDRVSLTIQNVTAKVLLEARLGNLVRMIDDVLNSLDLNPALATLGQGVGQVLNTTGGAVSGATGGSSSSGGGVKSRGLDFELEHNILYAVNDYSGNTHMNRILAQNGDIVEQSLHNDGQIYGEKVVGSYKTDMTFNGYNQTVESPPTAARELEYTYAPFPGLMVLSAIYVDAEGQVVKTQVLSESRAGGSSAIGGELKA